ncbi:hypothetical protein GCM10009801_82030 [Streptomyces albiaxialis]|uniref:Integrase n=1 Tax=Streptomyces albiaxialis TaxID=329523 RepID=A0ABP5IT23_9ACTN
MPEATQPPKKAPSRPREDKTATEPATVQRCQEDYRNRRARR